MLITTRKCLCATSELSLIDKFVYLSVLFLILIFASAGIFALVRNMLGVVLFMVTLYSALISGTELTFELPDKEKQCFYEELEEGVTFHVDYQVIAGGHYDVDCFVTDPVNNVLYEERKKQYDSLTHTTAMKGVYKVCFSNEFSTFSHKTVYLDFRSGPDDRLLPGMNNPTALTQIESTCISIHEILKVVADTQTKYRLREAQDRIRAEDLNAHVSYWSIGEAVIICVVSIGQVLMLKSFFKEKKTSSI